MNASRIELSPEEMRALGYRVIDILVEHFATLQDQRVGSKAIPEQIYAKLSEPPPEQGTPFEALLDQLTRDVFPNTMHVNHPRFFAFVPGPGNYVGAMADALAAGYNVFAGTWLGGSAAEAVETVTIDWLRQLCGFDDRCRGLFVSGGTIANLTALTVARHVILEDRLEHAVVYLSDQAHSSLEKALRVLGFLPDQIRRIVCDDDFRLPIPGLSRAIAQDRAAGRRPFCVIASAGTTNTGAVDPLPQLRDVCDREGLWLHVDGAYGAAAVLSDEGRRLLEGLPLADSLSLDPHKWLYQPFETGCVLIRYGPHLRATFRLLPDYLQDVHRHAEEVNYTDLGIQLTRSFRALKLWLSFKVFGIAAFREAIARGFRLAERAEQRLREMPGWEVSSPAQMAVVCFRYTSGDDALHAGLVEAMLREGFALCTSTTIRGRTVLRMCTINPRTTEEDVLNTLDRIDRLVSRGTSRLRDPAPGSRVVVRIGVTGHRLDNLQNANVDLLRRRVKDVVEIVRNAAGHAGVSPVLSVISPLAEGADRIVAEAAMAQGCDLHVVLPFARAEYEKDFPNSVGEFRRLLGEAADVVELDGSRESRAGQDQSYENAGRMVLRQSVVLIAVWSGKPAAGVGGTAQMVDEALRLGIPTVWVRSNAPHEATLIGRGDNGIDECEISELGARVAEFVDRQAAAGEGKWT